MRDYSLNGNMDHTSMSLRLSYIVPAYNAASYIPKTLDGIFALPLEEDELEVIVIDDCSIDDTLEVLNNIKQKHPNMVVLHQETNQRQGAARNRGIEIARGEYIAFCYFYDEIVADGVLKALYAVQLRTDSIRVLLQRKGEQD